MSLLLAVWTAHTALLLPSPRAAPVAGHGRLATAARRSVLMAAATKKKAAKKPKAGGASKGFSAATTAAPPPPAAPVELNPVDELFVVTDHPLPSGEGINTMFMGAFMIQDESVCDDLVALCDDHADLMPGVVGRGGRAVIDETSKHSMEMSFMPDDPRLPWRRYVTALQACTKRYVARYPYAANHVGAWGISSPTNFQFYPPSGGYKIFHTERNGRMEPGASRHLVFMTYLNDVTDEGGTEFFHQNVTIQPKKGLTLVWPSDWTFMHRGVPSSTQEKRIMTGWFNFA